MITLKHNHDATLHVWPASPQEWEQNPVISFTVANGTEVQKGDRIFAADKMATTGMNSGSIIRIYYYIDQVQEVLPLQEANIIQVTATAKRMEL